MSLLIRHGRVVDPASSVDAVQDVLITDGVITKEEAARSAGDMSRRLPAAVMFTGAARKPPSLPICHTSTPGIRLKSRIRKRESQPFRNRKR